MKKFLLIGGSLNRTRMVLAVAQHLEPHCDSWFTQYDADGLMNLLAERGWLDFAALGGRHRKEIDEYLQRHAYR